MVDHGWIAGRAAAGAFHAPGRPRSPSVVEVRRITMDDPLYAQECALREQVLLGPIGYDIGTFRREFPGFEERFEHFVAVFDHPSGPLVIGCATLLPGHPLRGGEPEARRGAGGAGGGAGGGPGGGGMGKLMQMAVDPQRQGEGIGTRLVIAAERRALGELGLAGLYCHAQIPAVGFYEALGWKSEGEVFQEAGLPHRRMLFVPPADADP